MLLASPPRTVGSMLLFADSLPKPQLLALALIIAAVQRAR
jgi:hypothetical protein